MRLGSEAESTMEAGPAMEAGSAMEAGQALLKKMAKLGLVISK